MSDVYSEIKKWLRSMANTQATASLFDYGFKIAARAGLLGGVCVRGTKGWYLLCPHEMTSDLLSEAEVLFKDILNCPWKDGRDVGMEIDSLWWYLNTLDFTYAFGDVGVSFGEMDLDKVKQWISGDLPWLELYKTIDVDIGKITPCLELHPVRKLLKEQKDAEEKVKRNARKGHGRKRKKPNSL